MKRKRGSGKRKPKKQPSTCTNESPLKDVCPDAQAQSNFSKFDNNEPDSEAEVEKLQPNTNKSCDNQAASEKVAFNNRLDDGANSLCEIDVNGSLNPSKKMGITETGPSRNFCSSHRNRSLNGLSVQDVMIQQKDSNSTCQDPRYNEQELNAALIVIKKIMKMEAATPFNVPVDPVTLKIPDYFDVIQTPMDFGTICNNLENGVKYANSEDVYMDVQYIWENCCKYNKKDDYIVELMKRVKRNFMKHWTAAGLCREQSRTPTNGSSHVQSLTESTMRVNKCHISPAGFMSTNPIHQQQDSASLSQVQHCHCSPSCSHAYQPPQRTYRCQSSFREPPPSHSPGGRSIVCAESRMRQDRCDHTCQMGIENGNYNHLHDRINPSMLPHQSSCTYSCLRHPEQRFCQWHSRFGQPPLSQIEANMNTCCAGRVHLPLHSELPTAKGCNNCPHSVCPVPGNVNQQQQYIIQASQAQAHQSSPSYSTPSLPNQKTCLSHLSPSQSQLSQPEAGIKTGNAGDSHLTLPTMKPCKGRQKSPVTDNNIIHRQQEPMGSSEEQFHQHQLIDNQSPKSPSQGERSYSVPPCDLLLPSANIESTDFTSKKRRGRGPTRCLKVWNIEGKISITTNELGQPIGPDAPKLTNFLGTLARNGHLAPLTYADWRAMPETNKEDMWAQVQVKFDVDPNSKTWVLKSLGTKWKNWKANLKATHYNTHATDEERLADCDERVLPDQWPVLISHWSSEEAEKRSATNKANRAQQKFNHCTGTKSFARLREEQKEKQPDGKELSRAELFILTRTRKDGQPVNEASSAVITQLRERATQQQKSPENNNGRDDIFSAVMGPDRHGRVRTFGLGPSPSHLGGTKPTATEALKMVSEANAEVREMKEKVAAMEQTCAQMAEQMATMMSMMSSMQRTSPEKLPSDVPGNASIVPKVSPQQQVLPSPSYHPVPTYETRARKRGKM